MTLDETIGKDVEKLAEYSKLAKFLQLKHEFVEKQKYALIHDPLIDDIFTFHPNGNCGCIELGDNYLFGICCDHLMWAEGWCEGEEKYFEDPTGRYEDTLAVLVYGNHKGQLSSRLLFVENDQTKDEGEDELLF